MAAKAYFGQAKLPEQVDGQCDCIKGCTSTSRDDATGQACAPISPEKLLPRASGLAPAADRVHQHKQASLRPGFAPRPVAASFGSSLQLVVDSGRPCFGRFFVGGKPRKVGRASILPADSTRQTQERAMAIRVVELRGRQLGGRLSHWPGSCVRCCYGGTVVELTPHRCEPPPAVQFYTKILFTSRGVRGQSASQLSSCAGASPRARNGHMDTHRSSRGKEKSPTVLRVSCPQT